MVQPPTAVTVTAPLWLWSGEGGSWHFITVPEEQAGRFRAESLARRSEAREMRKLAATPGADLHGRPTKRDRRQIRRFTDF